MTKTDMILNEIGRATAPSAHMMVLDFIIELDEEARKMKQLLIACQQEIVRLDIENNNLRGLIEILEEGNKE